MLWAQRPQFTSVRPSTLGPQFYVGAFSCDVTRPSCQLPTLFFTAAPSGSRESGPTVTLPARYWQWQGGLTPARCDAMLTDVNGLFQKMFAAAPWRKRNQGPAPAPRGCREGAERGTSYRLPAYYQPCAETLCRVWWAW